MLGYCKVLVHTDYGRTRGKDVGSSDLNAISRRTFAGKVHKRNTLEQLKLVGPNTLSVALLTAAFVGMVFTIQVALHLCSAA